MAAVERRKLSTLDPETLAAVAREVLLRLSQVQPATTPLAPSTPRVSSRTNRTATSIDDRVITSGTISGLPDGTAEVFVSARAVVTPSARDEASERGMTINRGASPTTAKGHRVDGWNIIDIADPSRAAAVSQQLSRRSLTACDAKIILSDTPAREAHHQCVRDSQVAVVVGSIDEAERFAAELDVTAWVLDMQRLSLTAAVNVAAQIARTRRSQR